MTYRNLLYELDNEGIALVTINRPEKLNILNKETIEELCAVVSKAATEKEIKAIIFTGEGERAFIAGADINELATYSPQDGKDRSLSGQAFLLDLEHLGKPVVAAINGYALGGGCELAMACHIRVAVESAKIGLPEVSLGIMPGYGGTQRMARLIGKGRAMELVLTGKPISATEAERIGLINKIVPDGEAVDAAREIVRQILQNGPLAVRASIEAINRGLEVPLAAGGYMEATLFGLLCATEDMKEGTQAFLEKRSPHFRGK